VYVPTTWQITVRDTVAQLISGAGLYLLAEWCEAIEDFSISMWREWREIPGFNEWWQEEITLHQEVQPEDHRALHQLMMRQLARGLMEGGRDRATLCGVIHRMTTAASMAEDTSALASDQLLKWLEGNPELHWSNGGYVGDA